ncbi:AsmA family protein [Luteimonas sp. M1R5S59]|uniref:AsmA family protein n=2 Tax=Luteimonas kalidii TaxID=3042025 RepID=A0ABT6JVG3_9GAMM|nr:AsmA family protein [Luteimonas kalidii]MDH5834671.1 AsmA family protein [Luteimonas kalidii]
MWVAIPVVALVVLVLLWDWNWFKGPVERIVEARTGRTFEIAGDLDVDLGRVTTVTAGQLRLGNAAWSDHRDMATAQHLALQVEVWPLLLGRVRLPELRLQTPDVRLETDPDGGPGNWDLGFEDDGGEPLQLRRLWIDSGRLRFDDAPSDTGIDVRVGSRESRSADAAPPVVLEGDGRWRGSPFSLEGTAESPLELQDSDSPFRIDLRARGGATRAHARGSLTAPFQLRGIDLQFALEGRNLGDLYRLIDVAMPDTPPYSVDGRLTRDGDTWHYTDFAGKVGQSDLAGSASITTGGERPLFKGDLVSKRLDLDDLAGFLGATPDAEGEALDPALAEQAARQRARGKVLPSTPYDLAKLRAMDADVRLRAQRINAPGLPIDDMDARLRLDNGLALLEPLNFGVAGGDIRSDIRMDARTDAITTRLNAQVRRVELARLFPDVELTRDAAGRVAGSVNLAGSGNSIAAMLATADGDVAVGMGRGEISNLLIELAGIDIYESLKFLLGKDRKVAVRCAFADFGVKRGVMDSRALAFDTSDTIIVGQGQVNLREESLDIELRPRPKDRSILALRSPLHIGGSFADPSFRPDFARLGLRGAIALALGSIAPPAALLATLELGPGEDSGCGGDYAK